jgi:hypothetical protein
VVLKITSEIAENGVILANIFDFVHVRMCHRLPTFDRQGVNEQSCRDRILPPLSRSRPTSPRRLESVTSPTRTPLPLTALLLLSGTLVMILDRAKAFQ